MPARHSVTRSRPRRQALGARSRAQKLASPMRRPELRALKIWIIQQMSRDDLQSLLFHFLDEWLYKFSADEFFIPREVKVLSIDQRNFKLRSIGWGEEFSLSKHPQCLSPTYKWKRLTSVIQALWRPRQADHLRSGVQDQPDQHGEIPS
ncbi:protein archease isoform X4 [Callithrix jacchus]